MKTNGLSCKYCGKPLRRSQTYKSKDKWLRFIGIKPYRCRTCRTLTYRFAPSWLRPKTEQDAPAE